MHQLGPKYFDFSPPPTTLGMGSIGQNSTFFSEHGHCCISNKGNHEMQQHGSKYFGCGPPPPPPLGIGSVGLIQLFQNMVMLHI